MRFAGVKTLLAAVVLRHGDVVVGEEMLDLK